MRLLLLIFLLAKTDESEEDLIATVSRGGYGGVFGMSVAIRP